MLSHLRLSLNVDWPYDGKTRGMYLPGQPTERAAKGAIAIRRLFERQKALRKG